MNIAAFVISVVSIVFAGISLFYSIKSQKLQNKVNEIEYKLKQYELDEKEQGSCIEARINHITKGKYKIKIWNSGNSPAKNVTASWEPPEGIIFFDKDKMPFEVLEPQKGFELNIHLYDGSPSKLKIKTEWEDENDAHKEKIQWCDL